MIAATWSSDERRPPIIFLQHRADIAPRRRVGKGELRECNSSHASADLTADPELTHDEVAERMSGNLCRCGCYTNIVAAIEQVVGQGDRMKEAAE